MASSDNILMEGEPEHQGNRDKLSNSDQMSLMNTVGPKSVKVSQCWFFVSQHIFKNMKLSSEKISGVFYQGIK